MELGFEAILNSSLSSKVVILPLDLALFTLLPFLIRLHIWTTGSNPLLKSFFQPAPVSAFGAYINEREKLCNTTIWNRYHDFGEREVQKSSKFDVGRGSSPGDVLAADVAKLGVCCAHTGEAAAKLPSRVDASRMSFLVKSS